MIPQHPALAPQPTIEEPPRRGEGLLVFAAVLLGALAVLGSLVGYQRWRSDPDTVAAVEVDTDEGSNGAAQPDVDSGSTPSTLAPTDPSTPPSTADPDTGGEPEPAPVQSVPCPETYDEVICRAADFVQQTRGRPFKQFPSIELLGDREFDQALVTDIDEARADIEEDELLLKSLGLIPVDLDLFDAFRSLIQSGVVGFYDPETGRLVVRGGEFDLYGQSILVHELVHAYDDQWFDLGRDSFEDDAEYGFAAVIEGNASRVEQLWQSELSSSDQSSLMQQEFDALSPEDLDRLLSLPRVILNLQISPYQDGGVYVSDLVRRGGEAGVDERLTVPPQSSEQVLHSGAPPADLVVVEVEPPPVDGPTLDGGAIGELLVDFWLGSQAAVGWGGDHYVVWQSGSRTCITVDLAADSAPDLAEMEAAAEVWVAEQPDGRAIQRIESVDRSLLRVDGCY